MCVYFKNVFILNLLLVKFWNFDILIWLKMCIINIDFLKYILVIIVYEIKVIY